MDSKGLRAILFTQAPARPAGWVCEEEYPHEEPVWENREEYDRLDYKWMMFLQTFGSEATTKEEVEKLKDLRVQRIDHNIAHENWTTRRNTWLDAKWRSWWVDRMMEECNA